MTLAVHRDLAAGRWQQLSLVEQLANIGSEAHRASAAKTLGNEARSAAALDRLLELFDLTLADGCWIGRRRELARAREIALDFLVGDNVYGSSPQSLDAYFLPFAMAARALADRRNVTRATALIATSGPE